MYIVCKKDNESLAIAKYYPLGGGIGGEDSKDNSGWYTQTLDILNEFFIKHKHNFDTSHFGGFQYSLAYEVSGNGKSLKEELFKILDESKK